MLREHSNSCKPRASRLCFARARPVQKSKMRSRRSASPVPSSASRDARPSCPADSFHLPIRMPEPFPGTAPSSSDDRMRRFPNCSEIRPDDSGSTSGDIATCPSKRWRARASCRFCRLGWQSCGVQRKISNPRSSRGHASAPLCGIATGWSEVLRRRAVPSGWHGREHQRRDHDDPRAVPEGVWRRSQPGSLFSHGTVRWAGPSVTGLEW